MDARHGKVNVLENRTECMNRVSTYINEVVPKLLDALKHGFGLTSASALYSKDMDRFNDIIALAHTKDILSDDSSICLKSDEYSIYLEISDSYTVSHAYHNQGQVPFNPTLLLNMSSQEFRVIVYLWNNQEGKARDFRRCEMVDIEQMREAKSRIADIHEQIAKLKAELYPLQILTGSQR